MSCRVIDDTYIKVKGEWIYHYRAVDKYRKTIDFKLSARRDKAAAHKFFQKLSIVIMF
jgi:putative transposase